MLDDILKISELSELLTPEAGDQAIINDISEEVDIDKTKRIGFGTWAKYSSLILEVEKSLNHTFELSDAGKIISLTGSTGRSFTVPPNNTVPFLIGTIIAVVKDGTGDLTLVEGAGVTIKKEIGLVVTGQYAMAAIIKVGTNVWRAIGNLNV